MNLALISQRVRSFSKSCSLCLWACCCTLISVQFYMQNIRLYSNTIAAVAYLSASSTTAFHKNQSLVLKMFKISAPGYKLQTAPRLSFPSSPPDCPTQWTHLLLPGQLHPLSFSPVFTPPHEPCRYLTSLFPLLFCQFIPVTLLDFAFLLCALLPGVWK